MAVHSGNQHLTPLRMPYLRASRALSAFDTSPSRKSISDSNPPNGQTSSVGRTLQTAPSGIAASGAPPTPPTAAAGQHSDHGSVALAPGKVLTEHVASVFFLHKYSQPVECSVTMQRMGIGTECIVEVTLRRVGPPQMLVLTGASGRIKWVVSVPASLACRNRYRIG